MLTRILFLLLALCVALQIFSQDELGIPKLKKRNDYWSVGYYASGNLSLINGYVNDEAVQPGYGAALELFYNDTKRNLVLIISKNKINTKIKNRYFETFELTTGPRFNLNKNGSFFAELTLGGLMISRISKNYLWGYNLYPYYKSDPHFSFGLTGAIGKKFSVNNNTDFIVKLRMLSTISFNDGMFTYLTATGGITFNTKKYDGNQRPSTSYVGIALMAGGNNPSILSQWEYNWGTNYCLEFTYRVSPKIELLLDGNYNKIYRADEGIVIAENYTASVTAGGRFLINESPATAFIEIGAGLYSYTYQYFGNITGEKYSSTEDYGGINIGTGTKIRLNNLINLLLKGNLHFIFSEEHEDIPNYLSVRGGIRFNL